MDYTVHGILQARILEWVTFPFSRGSSQPRDRTQASCIAGGFFTSWATREAQEYWRWVSYPFSSRFSRPRNWTRVSCIAGGFFTNWAIREALFFKSILKKCFKHIPTISSIPFLVYYPKRKHAAAAKSLQLCPTVRPHWQQHRSIQRLVHTDPWMFIVILFVKTRN